MAVLLVAFSLVLAACASEPIIDGASTAPAGIVREPAPDVSHVVLPDASDGGAPFTMQAQPGEILLVYFGYTSCPDVCPTTLADVRNALRSLAEAQSARVDLAMITVDPDRDDGERLRAYTQTFVAAAHALRTEDETVLREAAESFGASYDVTTGDDGMIEVSHSAFLYAVDSTGHIRLSWPFGTPKTDIADDLQYLFEQGV